VSTATLPPPGPAKVSSSKEEQPYVDLAKKRRTGLKLLGIAVFWLLGWALFKGHDTKAIAFQQTTGFHDWLNRVRDWVQIDGQDNWFFGGVLGAIADFANNVLEFLQKLISTPAFPRPVPEIGWVGVVGLVAWFTYVVAGLRATILVTVSLLAFGIFGFWPAAIDTLIITGVAVVACIVVGLPVGVLMARNNVVSAAVTPVLDAMQTMPAFCYLLPMVLFFGIGSACAVLLTFVYALPPLIRITEHGIRSVSPGTVEASHSLGVSRSQLLRQVQLPMAKRTIVVGINQSTMAALSMATIAALVAGPGLGPLVITALQNENVGQAGVPSLAIVFMAIMLDRTTTAASERASSGRSDVASVSGPGVMLTGVVIEHLPRWATEDAGKGQRLPRLTTAGRWLLLSLLLIPVLVLVWLSRFRLDFANFPDVSGTPVLKYLNVSHLATYLNDFKDWFVGFVDTFTLAVKNAISYGLINPLQNLMANSPWWVMAVVLLALAWVLGGWRPTAITLVCEAVIYGTGLWNDSMITLTMVLIATLIVMVFAVVLGVVMGRSKRADLLIRPFLDAFQTIPPFVYLVPALALFSVGRFTAIIAAVAYAVPIATKLVADGIRGVSPTTIEAVRSSGSTRWQVISKVQLPMAREALVLATNQGLLYVLSMVVIGGMVGGGSLGYLVVSGFSQGELFGKGLAAGIAITAMGVMLDRIARYAAVRYGR
jgi:glycine betaine/proline transport system permease protein